jgi:hypothetical protein
MKFEKIWVGGTLVCMYIKWFGILKGSSLLFTILKNCIGYLSKKKKNCVGSLTWFLRTFVRTYIF